MVQAQHVYYGTCVGFYGKESKLGVEDVWNVYNS